MARILLIEDDVSLRTVLRRALEDDGHIVVAAGNGQQGLQQVQDCAPDLVITDVNMPDKDGLEVITALRYSNRHLKVVAMSGGGRMPALNLLLVAQALGASATIAKPFLPDDFKRFVDAALAHSHGPAGPPPSQP